MSDLHPDLDDLLKPLRHDADETQPLQLSAAARARVLAALQTQVKQVPRRRQRMRLLRVAAPIALACAAGFVLMVQRAEPPAAVHVVATGARLSWTQGERAARELDGAGAELRGTGELVVPTQASAQLTTAAGVWMQAAPQTRLRLTASDRPGEPAVRLHKGLLHCRVPKLGPGHSFVVAAERAQVIVHGTDFSVELGGRETVSTDQPCVRVREGLVEVQRAAEASVWLRPGEAWGCVEPEPALPPAVSAPQASAAPADSAPPSPARTRVRRAGKQAGHARRAPQLRAADPALSTLERENQLLGLALSAERRGDGVRAHTLFEALLRQYPSSVLTPEAQAGRDRTRAR